MGLDINLYHYDNYEETQTKETTYELLLESLWKKLFNDRPYNDISEEEGDTYRFQKDVLKFEVGVPLPGELSDYEQVNLNSNLYPNHYFQIGYFRSSYNGSGINSKLTNWINEDLYSIFSKESEDYVFRPDWTEVRSKTLEVLEKLKTYFKENGAYDVFKFQSYFKNSNITDEASALENFLTETKRGAFSSEYSNRFGDFFLGEKPLQVRALIQGEDNLFNRCVYVVTDSLPENTTFYSQGLEIIIETCDYVLKQPDQDKYYLHWSS
jgi:hypothetical protein